MPLTYDETREYARLKGFNPDEVDVDSFTGAITPKRREQPTMSTAIPAPKTTGALETIGRQASLSVLPSAVSIPASTAVGVAVTAKLSPLFAGGPYTGWIPPVAGIATGLGTGLLTSLGASKVQESLLSQIPGGQEYLAKSSALREERPVASAIGDVAGSLPFMKVNPKMLKDAAHALTTERAAGAGFWNKLGQSEAAQNVLISGALGGATSVGEDLMADKDVNVTKALVNTVMQGAVSDVRPWMAKIPGLRNAPYRGQPLAEPAPNVMGVSEVERTAILKEPATGDEAAKLTKQIEELDTEIARLDEIKAKTNKVTQDIVYLEAEKNLKDLNTKKAALEKALKGDTRTYTEFVASPENMAFTTAKAQEKGVADVTFEDTGRLAGKGGETYGEFDAEKNTIRASTYAGTKGKDLNLPERAVLPKDVQAAPTTGPHETIHAEIYNILNSERAAQTRMGEQLRVATENSPEYKRWLETHPDKTWDEYATIRSAAKFALDPSNKGRSWAAERAALKRLQTGKGTADDVDTILLMKWRYDRGLTAPRGAAGAKAPVRSAMVDDVNKEIERLREQPATEQLELPMAKEGTPLTKWLRDNYPEFEKPQFGDATKGKKFSTPEGEEIPVKPESGFEQTVRSAEQMTTDTLEAKRKFASKHPKLISITDAGEIMLKTEPNEWGSAALSDWLGVTPGALTQYAKKQGLRYIRDVDWNRVIAENEYRPKQYPQLESKGGKAKRDEYGAVVMRERPLNEKVDIEKTFGQKEGVSDDYALGVIKAGVLEALMPRWKSGHVTRRARTRWAAEAEKEEFKQIGKYADIVSGQVINALETEGLNLKGVKEGSTFDDKVFFNARRIAQRILRDDIARLERRKKEGSVSLDQEAGDNRTVGDTVSAGQKVVYGDKRATTVADDALVEKVQADIARLKAQEQAANTGAMVKAESNAAVEERLLNAFDEIAEGFEFQRYDEGDVWKAAADLSQAFAVKGLNIKRARQHVMDTLRDLGIESSGGSADATPTIKYSTPEPDETPTFVTQFEKELRVARPFGLQVGKDGRLLSSEIIAKLRTLPAIEQELLRNSGLEDKLKVQSRISAEDLKRWLDENGPKVEVLNYGMEGKVSEAKREYNRMTHEWFETLGDEQQAEILSAAIPEDISRRVFSYNESYEKALEYFKLKKAVDKEPFDTSPRATSYYNTVSALPANEPMPEWTTTKDSWNVQRVDVVVPQKFHPDKAEQDAKNWKKLGYASKEDFMDAARNISEYYDKPTWQPDNLHENIPNTLGWAMLQYKTGPKGEKMAVVVEAQSRWGQRLRELKQNKPENGPGQEREVKNIDHPLLRDYNRLILKAAIDQARKENATHIVVSDAETAMMTEGHDVQVERVRELVGVDEMLAPLQEQFKAQYPNLAAKFDLVIPSDVTTRAGLARNPFALVNKNTGEVVYSLNPATGDTFVSRGAGIELESPVPFEWRDSVSAPEQEGGMRFNYDEMLPRIARDITGDEGTRVSLGEHKNAFEGGKTVRATGEDVGPDDVLRRDDRYVRFPRKNLIFRNADGTPKTDVSGTMFDISAPAARRASGEEFSIAGKRYSSPEPEGITYPDQISDFSKQGPVERFAAQFDQVRKYDTKVADAFVKAELLREINEGQYLHSTVHDFRKEFGSVNERELKRAYDYALGMYRNPESVDKSSFTKREIALASFWNDRISRPVREHQQKLDMQIETRDGLRRKAKLSEWYAPEMLNDKAIDVFTKSTDTTESTRLKNLWVEHVVEMSANTDKPISSTDARKDIDQFVSALGRRGAHAADFGALRKAAGFGLPEELRERNLLRVMERYASRASRDLAKVEGLEIDPYVRGKLLLDDPATGERGKPEDGNDLLTHKEVRNAMKFITGDFEINRSPRLLSTVRAVTNAMLGPMTGVRDTATVIVNSLPYMKFSDLPTIFTSLSDFNTARRKSLEYGARTGKHPLDAIATPLGTDAYVNTFNIAAEALRKYSGRDAIEQFNRIWTFAIGRELANQAVLTKNEAFLKKFGMAADQQVDGKTVWNTDIMAKNFTDRVQGSYGGRGLPAIAVDGMAAPWFALARWSLEKANITWNDVLKPAYTGKDFTPLLMYTVGAWLTGEAIEKLNEELQAGKKSQDASWKEIEAADGGIEQVALRLANIMQLGSFLGMTGDMLKMGADIAKGEKPRGYSVPLADFISDGIVGSVTNFSRAVQDGADPLDAVAALTQNLARTQLQAYRVANYWVDREQVDRSNKFRDLRVFKQTTGREVPSDIQQINPAMREDEREFKRSSDPLDAASRLRDVLDRFKVEYKDDPAAMSKALERLRRNSYQTFPSPDRDLREAQEYYNYLVRAYGKAEADARVEDYMRQTQLNRMKSTAIPTLSR